MSVFDRILCALRRVPRGFPADGRQLGLGLAAALDAQRARADRPVAPVGDWLDPVLPDRRSASGRDDAATPIR